MTCMCVLAFLYSDEKPLIFWIWALWLLRFVVLAFPYRQLDSQIELFWQKAVKEVGRSIFWAPQLTNSSPYLQNLLPYSGQTSFKKEDPLENHTGMRAFPNHTKRYFWASLKTILCHMRMMSIWTLLMAQPVSRSKPQQIPSYSVSLFHMLQSLAYLHLNQESWFLWLPTNHYT